jgi:hypothetical protein
VTNKRFQVGLSLTVLAGVFCFWYLLTQWPTQRALARCRGAYAAARTRQDSARVDAMLDTIPSLPRNPIHQPTIMWCDHRELRRP